MASGIYYRFNRFLMVKEHDMESDDIRAALLDTNHSFSGGNLNWSELSANEVSGTGYTAGGKALTGKAVTQAGTTKWDANDAVWTSATFTAYHAVIYNETQAETNELICSIDFGGAKGVVDGTFTLQWDAAGIITLT